jgi:restriction endonuclease Mrr
MSNRNDFEKRDHRKASDGYHLMRGMISECNSREALEKVVNKILPMIKEYQLDDYQQARLEEFGMNQYYRIERETMRMANEISRNKFKK